MNDKQNMDKSVLPQLTENIITLFQHTIEQSPQAVFWLNSNGRFEYVNEQACKSLGYTRDELLSLFLWDIDPDYPIERWRPHWEELRKVVKRTFETKHVRKDGYIFPVEVSAYQIHFEGKEFHAAFVNDITELVKARKEQKELEDQLHQAQKLEAIGTLAGGIAHDFNNMLSVIIGYSELLKANISEDNDSMKSLMQIEKAAFRSRDITRQLLAFSRKQVITPVTIDINHQINDTLKILGRLIGEQIELEFNPNEEIGKTKLDPSQFDQILINLAVNARDAMPHGGKLEISTSNAVLDGSYPQIDRESSPKQYVLLSVTDNGIGMDQETLSHIFEPFFTTKELGRGTGLGLATVYGIIKQNNGIVDIQSHVGKGSRFNIYFPVIEGQGKNVEITDPVAITSDEGKILLVEDDEMVRNMTLKMLESLGYTVFSVANPFAAISFCSTNDTHIDLLFSDIVMPKMDGTVLSDKIRDLKPGIQVLFMSGYEQELGKRKKIISKGFHFIEKPFSKNELGLKIDSILNEPTCGKDDFR